MTDAILFDAIEFAARAHRGHYRKGTRVPYLVHPLRVSSLLAQVEAPLEVVVAGVLHDTVEDTDTTLEQIGERFGERVATLVAGATEPDRGASWEERKTHTIAWLARADPAVRLLACADKVDNVRSMQRGARRLGDEFWSRFSRPRSRQAWYYREVARVLTASAEEPALGLLVAELDRRVDELFGPGQD